MNRTDVLVALAVTAVALAGLAAGAVLVRNPEYELEVLSVGLAVAQGGVLLWRRRYPVAVLATSSLFVAVHVFFHHPNASSELGPFAAAYAVGAYASVQVGVPAVVAAAALAAWSSHTHAGVSPGIVVAPGDVPTVTAAAVTNAALFAVAFLLGWAVRSRRESAAARLETALSDERTRIARELHDVIAHHVGAMVIQAGAARRVLERDGDTQRVRDALAAIERSGRTALTAVPVVIGALRGEASGTAPQPTLALLDEVTKAAEEAGLNVDVTVEGKRRDLPAAVEVSAFRIVQEAVTNAMKHAGQATVRIRLRYAPEALHITVADDGRGAATESNSGGYGLAGMRERAELLGGRLEAGPRPGGGFAVHASLPVPAS